MNSFKYCPNCKTKIKLSNRLIDCTNCGFHFYINPATTNALIIENINSEVLLVKRKFQPKKGYWDLPGGFVDFDESMEESVKREIKEELGIIINEIRYFISIPDRYLYKRFNYHTLCFIFISKAGSEKLTPTDDITEVSFFKKTELPFSRIAFKGIKYALRLYIGNYSLKSI